MLFRMFLPWILLLVTITWLPADDLLVQNTPGLKNVIRVTPKLLSGSSPEGELGYKTLQKLGVRTIISVDGAQPDLPLARKHELRYVHLPIGYDGVPAEQGLRLAKAVKELPGLIYMHCHHGKHRSPAAAAVVKLHLEETCTSATALAILRAAGTDQRYTGLYAASRDYQRNTIDWSKISADYPEKASTGTLVQKMVALDEHWERLKLAEKAGWRPPADHPDIDPTHEALMLWEHYVEWNREPTTKQKPAVFHQMLNDGETAAKRLEATLRQPPSKERTTNLALSFAQSHSACARCHSQYRDVPQDKK